MYHDANLGAGVFSDDPVDDNTVVDGRYKFHNGYFQLFRTHDLNGALVHRQGIVESDFVVSESQVDTLANDGFGPRLPRTD